MSVFKTILPAPSSGLLPSQLCVVNAAQSSFFPSPQPVVTKSDSDMPSVLSERQRAAHKILHYGSRHVIQNNGWTTRLTKELPHLKPLQGKTTTFKPASDSNPLSTDSAKVPVTSTAPKQNVVQPDSVNNGLMISFVGPNRDAAHVLPTIPSSSAGNMLARPVCVLSDQYPLQRPAIVCPTPPAVNAVPTVLPSHLTIPSRPPNICLIPLSAPGQVAVVRSYGGNLTTPSTQTFPGVKQSVVLPTPLPGLSNMSQPALYSNFTSCATSGRILNLDNARPLNPVERSGRSSVARSVKTLSVYPTNDTTGVPEIRVLNTQVRIDNGLITEVNELSTKSGSAAPESAALAGLSICGILSDSSPHQHPVYLTDVNGAQFGYIESGDGQRVRIAHDTSGQRYSPFLLLQPKTGSFVCSDVSVDVCTYSKSKIAPVPTEAEVSAVGTVFTYEPLFVSEQTLAPVSSSNFEPKNFAPANEDAEDDSYFAYRCYLCQYWSLDQTKLARHWLNVHMPELQYCCPHCDRRFFTNVRAQLHVQHQHSKSGLPTVAFRHSEHFAHSLRFEVAPVDESDCSSDAGDGDGDTNNKITLENTDENEQQRMLNNMPFTCRKCNFQTRSLHELRQHGQSIHVRFRPFVCDYCDHSSGSGRIQPSFATRANLIQHIKAKHPRQFKNNCEKSRFDVSASESQTSVILRAKIPWSESWEEIFVAGERVLQCRRCTFQAATARNIWPHVLRQHKWPANIYCPQCLTSVAITNNDRITGVLSCSVCSQSVTLGPADSDSMISDGEIVYVCNICSFKTRERSSMIRHLKYNHTKCRPYACPYCSFVAVEWPKVHMHAATNHPDLPAVVRDQADSTDQFRHVVNFLFSKLVSVMLVDPSSSDLMSAEVDSIDLQDGKFNQTDASLTLVKVKTEQDLPTFCCSSCSLETSDLQELKGHQCAASNIESGCGNSAADASINTFHFKCRVCGYYSTDRSSMARHVKYMHIRARPHSCPYCAYNNVEKAKVRMHVKAHHPLKQRYVHTDHKLLEQLSWHAKQFYIRVSSKGNEVQENVCQQPDVGSTSDIAEQFYANKNSSADSISSNEWSPSSSPPVDARLSSMSAITDGLTAASAPNGDKLEDWELHDDVEFEIKPDWMTQRNPEMFGRDAFLAVDHNYYSVGKLPPKDRSSEPRPLAVKQEPIDSGYENVYVFPAAFDSFSIVGLAASSEQSNANCETMVDIKPDVASQTWSESDDDDAFFSSDLSDDACSLPSNDDCKPQLDLLGDPNDAAVNDSDLLKPPTPPPPPPSPPPPPVQKRELDCEFAASDDFDAVKIDPKVLNDPKIKKMRAVVELQDVVQLIYALQSGGLDLLG